MNNILFFYFIFVLQIMPQTFWGTQRILDKRDQMELHEEFGVIWPLELIPCKPVA